MHSPDVTSPCLSWPQILTSLSDKAKREGHLEAIKKEQGMEQVIRKVQDMAGIRRKITSWISQCSESKYQKSGGTASKLRDEGNLKFQHRDNRGSLKLYSESVICSPEFGPELSLAFGNRSAALYHQGRFQASLQDISLALQHRFPKDSEYKLYQRRGLCLMKLKHYDEALEALQKASASLELVTRLPRNKKASNLRDIKAMIVEVNSLKASESNGHSRYDDGEEMDTGAKCNSPVFGENRSIPGASVALDLHHDPDRGRHIVCNREVDLGEVLFSELPFASVLLPEHYATHCHHCHKKFEVPVPCLKCTQARYCGDQCRTSSWDRYHQFECSGLDLLHSVGVAQLAVRTVLLCGMENLKRIRPFVSAKDFTLSPVNDLGGDEELEKYLSVFRLVEHSKSTGADDLFQYAVSALLLATFLEQRTKFFYGAGSNMDSAFGAMRLDSKSEESDEELVVFVAAVILKHILQLVCNASAVFEVGPAASEALDFEDYEAQPKSSSTVYAEKQYRIATAIYPSASLMNHSCDPTVISSFRHNRLIARTIKKVFPGEDVFNCYGPHHRRHKKKERQEMLLSQYNFVCHCQCCLDKSFDQFIDRFFALKCRFCSGPIEEPDGTGRQHVLPCLDCGKEQSYAEQIEVVFAANELMKKGQELYANQDFSSAIECLQQCLILRKQALYVHNEDVVRAADQLAECYAMAGHFEMSAILLRQCLVSIELRFGPSSIEYAHDLVKLSDVLLAQLENTDKSSAPAGYSPKIIEEESLMCMNKAEKIFRANYGEDDNNYVSIQKKIAMLTS